MAAMLGMSINESNGRAPRLVVHYRNRRGESEETEVVMARSVNLNDLAALIAMLGLSTQPLTQEQ